MGCAAMLDGMDSGVKIIGRLTVFVLLLAAGAAGAADAQDPEKLPDLLQPLVAPYEEAFRGAGVVPTTNLHASLPAAGGTGELRTAGTAGLAARSAAAHAPAYIEPNLKKNVRELAALQIALDRRGFGTGPIDASPGLKTRQALLDFRYAMPHALDEEDARRQLLEDPAPVFIAYEVTADDLAQVGEASKDWEEAADLPAMNCHSLQEWMGEKFHASPGMLRMLNPGVTKWNEELLGRRICVPNIRPEEVKFDVRQITIDTHCFRLRGYDLRGRMVCSFPCSIAKDRTKVPAGELKVVNVAPHPNYTFDPINFPESARAREIGRKLILPPGPRNPVGVYWVSLSQPGYGIHGTPHPETIGNMESHGCFRLCNWDAHTLGQGVMLGLPVLLDKPALILK